MDKSLRNKLKDQYINRTVIGGVYCIKCDGNDRVWIKSTKDMTGQKNKFKFSISTNSCPEPSMCAEWKKYGAESFSLTVLEEIKKGETQTQREFIDDIDALFEMWLEKQQQEDLK